MYCSSYIRSLIVETGFFCRALHSKIAYSKILDQQCSITIRRIELKFDNVARHSMCVQSSRSESREVLRFY